MIQNGMSNLLFLLICCVVSCNATVVSYSSHPEITTGAMIVQDITERPKDTLKYPIGQVITVVCGVINNSVEPIRITQLAGTLNNNDDFGTVIQRLPVIPVHYVLEPASEVSFEYKISPHENREGAENRMALHVVYEGERGHVYSNVYLNKSLEFVIDSSNSPEVMSFATYVTLASLLSGASVLLSNRIFGIKIGRRILK